MTKERHILQIRNGIYLLCFLSALTLIVGVSLNIHLANQSFERMKSLGVTASTEQALINELSALLDANELDRLIARGNEVLKEKPLSRTGHFYLGLAYYHSGDASKCRKHLEEARRIDPSWKPAIDPFLGNLKDAPSGAED
ncbi:MAG: tetratricopeptide repeat protein [Verrucomicrobiales bacterium]|nr:tetratricopeptide repeat protein [Verrucomicrobiales bacterium]